MPHLYTLRRQQWVPAPLETIFDFFSHAENLQQLTPPLLDFHIANHPGELGNGSRIEYVLKVHGFPMRWISEISNWDPPHGFVDTQVKGPYKFWRHQHGFAAERDGTRLEDEVTYALPFGPLGHLAHWALVESDLDKVFEYRQAQMRSLFGGPPSA